MVNNRILRSLPSDEFVELRRHLSPETLVQRGILNAMNEPIDNVHFIESGMVSLILLSQSGGGIETGMVGSEGMIGGFVAIGTEISPVQATVQIAGQAFKCPVPPFLDAYEKMGSLRKLVNTSIAHLLLEAQQNTLCHALHSVESRLCRWLLQTRDMLHSNVFDLTQEFLSNMLGVQRTSVSITAHALQRSGFIRYRRGRIEIVNSTGLEDSACECYRALSGKLSASEHTPAQVVSAGSP